MKLFLDANILFSAAYGGGTTADALALIAELAECEIMTSQYAVDEARRNIEIKAPAKLQALEAVLALCARVGEPDMEQLAQAESALPDPDDAPILAAARAAKVDILVTGDLRHFGHLFDRLDLNPRVMRLRDALTEVLRAES